MAEQPGAASEKADFLIALNQETIDRHRHRLGETGTIIADSGTTRAGGAIGIPVGEILSSDKAHPVMGNSAMIGAFSRAAGMRWEEVEPVLKVSFPRETDLNLKVARRGYDAVTEVRPLMRIPGPVLPSLTGNEAIALGLVRGGLQAYFGYPMSPTTNIFHFLVGHAQELGIAMVQPEGEIAVVQMALGGSYAGCRTVMRYFRN